jgi:mannitol/fructose-specific phosphotransferase system IIA component (Ntr-type)
MTASHEILISNLLDPQVILLDVDITDKTILLKHLCNRMAEVYDDVNRKEFYHHILKREQELSTGIGKHIAIPHAIARNACSLHLLFATHQGIEYDSLDGKLVNIILMLAIPPDQKQIYSTFLMKISQMMSIGHLSNEFMNAVKPNDIITLFKQHEEVS